MFFVGSLFMSLFENGNGICLVAELFGIELSYIQLQIVRLTYVLVGISIGIGILREIARDQKEKEGFVTT